MLQRLLFGANLFLLLTVGLLWVRSLWFSDWIFYDEPGVWVQRLGSKNGTVRYCHYFDVTSASNNVRAEWRFWSARGPVKDNDPDPGWWPVYVGETRDSVNQTAAG